MKDLQSEDDSKMQMTSIKENNHLKHHENVLLKESCLLGLTSFFKKTQLDE